MNRKSAVLVGAKEFKIVEEAIPTVGDNDILVKLVACGLCHTDVPTYLGASDLAFNKFGQPVSVPGVNFPAITGHEPVGIVQEVGKNVTKFKVGDFAGGFIQNAFTSHIVINENMIFKISDKVEDLKHCLAEPLTCISNILRAANPKFGDYTAVVGCGLMGLLTIAGLSKCGAREVIAIDFSDERLEKAKEMGATITINPSKVDVYDEIQEITNVNGVDVVVEITGSLKGLNTALKIVRNADIFGYKGRGKILTSSVYARPETWDPEMGANLMLKAPILHSAHPTYSDDYERDVMIGVDAYIKGILPMDKLVTHEFTLEEIGKGFEMLASGDTSMLKGIVVF
ncbi:MAG: zinc-binding dehydrogenase [Clostridium sp.]